jgi:hypothetical protein
MIHKASENSEIAVYSLEANPRATSSSLIPKAISTAPPPATTNPVLNKLLEILHNILRINYQ